MALGRIGTVLGVTAFALSACGRFDSSEYRSPTDFDGGTQENILSRLDPNQIDQDRLFALEARINNGEVEPQELARELEEITGITAKNIRDFLVIGIEEELNALGRTMDLEKFNRLQLIPEADRCVIDRAIDHTMFYLPSMIGQAFLNFTGDNTVVLDEDSLTRAYELAEAGCRLNYANTGDDMIDAREISNIALVRGLLSLASRFVSNAAENVFLDPRRSGPRL